MSNGNFQHESDDELLSAYIDGELSEAERAAVEARLANDSDAQQLVHQLRSVSQSVQRLPLEAVGRDLSEAILRRAEAMKPTPAAAPSAAPAEGRSQAKSGIFHSRQPWIWASLAMAAGLMIMFLQRNAENQKKLPAVAQTTEGRVGDGDRSLKESTLGRVAGGEKQQLAIDPMKVAQSESGRDLMPMAAPPSAPPDALPPRSESLSDQIASNDSPNSYAYRGGALGNQPQPPAGAATTTTPSAPVLTDVPTDEEIRKGVVATRPASPAPAVVSGTAGIAAPAPAAEPAPASPVAPAPQVAKSEKPMPLEADGKNHALFDGDKEAKPAPADVAAAGQRGRGFGGAASDAAFHDAREGAPPEAFFVTLGEGKNPPVVVHVVANAESFRKQSIDKLLTNRGVVVEPQQQAVNEKRSGGAVSGVAENEEASRLYAKTKGGSVPFGDSDFDLVLVEAPKATIASCLTDLKGDATNYVSVEIDEPGVSKDRADASGTRDKKLESDFGKYNRGVVSQEQKLAFQNFYSQLDAAGKEPAKGEGGGGGVNRFSGELGEADGKQPPEEAKKVDSSTRGSDGQARARRLSRFNLNLEGEKLRERAPQGGIAGAPAARALDVMRRGQVEAKTADGAVPVETLQVLFVISPQPPAAAATSAPAEPSAPTQKASK